MSAEGPWAPPGKREPPRRKPVPEPGLQGQGTPDPRDRHVPNRSQKAFHGPPIHAICGIGEPAPDCARGHLPASRVPPRALRSSWTRRARSADRSLPGSRPLRDHAPGAAPVRPAFPRTKHPARPRAGPRRRERPGKRGTAGSCLPTAPPNPRTGNHVGIAGIPRRQPEQAGCQVIPIPSPAPLGAVAHRSGPTPLEKPSGRGKGRTEAASLR